jgi:hypothetical protein
MSYIDRDILQDFPFEGRFYRVVIDDSVPLDEREEEEVTVLETPCDIAKSSHSWAQNFIWAKYVVTFPLDLERDEVVVKMGDLFRANMYGLDVNGKVVGVFPSQMGGVTVYVQDTDV